MSAAEICQSSDHDTRVCDRLLKRHEMDPWIAGGVMREGRQRVAIGLRDILSRDSVTRIRSTKVVLDKRARMIVVVRMA